ncbi:MAG: hypothetical protein FD153_389 [Rhodospirillaceae bacterium]|nr:MAG: hypothetical protein FD153_389 [Rhodospirillaceae bacterium]
MASMTGRNICPSPEGGHRISRYFHLAGVVGVCVAVTACAIGPRKRHPAKVVLRDTVMTAGTPEGEPESPPAGTERRDTFLPVREEQSFSAMASAVLSGMAASTAADVLPVPVPPPVSTGESAGAEEVTGQLVTLPEGSGPIGPMRLHGLGRREVRAFLGEPGLLRRDPPAEVWQYHSLNCVVDLFLYADKNEQRVAYVQVRSLKADGQQVNETECLNRIARSHHQKF